MVADTFVSDPTADNPEYAGINTSADPRDLKVHRDQPPRDVPYLPTDQHVVNKMLEMAKVTKADTLYDLGCGDGRICITAAKLGARAVGVDIDLQRIRECHDNLRNTNLKHLVEFRRQSFFDTDLRPATVLALYLLPAINKLLRPKMLFELRPGTRVVANYFEIADWVPDDQILFKHRPVMLWIVPAWIQGTWKALFRTEDGLVRHATLELTRNIQFVSGTTRLRGRTLALHGRLRGNDLQLNVPELGAIRGPITVEATFDNGESKKTTATLVGTFKGAGISGRFAAMRVEK